ncbi:hypothetical protein ACP70R_021198 [Stipagrostis hirtigluma subsp. patula]
MATSSSSTAARNPRQIRASRLAAALKTTDSSVQGKSKFFLEHQAMREREKEEGINNGYDTAAHGWRYAQQLPLPEGKWPSLSKFRGGARDEHEKEQAAKWHREENRLRQEDERRNKLVEQELRRQLERLAAAARRNGRPPPPPRRVRVGESHVSNVEMAVRFLNGENPDGEYELWEITAASTIMGFGETHCHYNFSARSPTHGFRLFFAEVDVTFESERRVLQCCAIDSGPVHGLLHLLPRSKSFAFTS